MYCGIDIGTSSVKAVLIDDNQDIKAVATHALSVSRLHSLWSEQQPEDWWDGVVAVLDQLAADHANLMSGLRGVGLSGHMHGATLLGADDRPLRPCILWNNGRSEQECLELEKRESRFRSLGGNIVMPGFTAPKLEWVRKHEPETFEKTKKVLLPKDYVRLLLTGEYAGEMSDSAGTLWLDVAKRDWSDPLLAATGLDRSHMPLLVEGSEISGTLKPELARRWGMKSGVVVAGGGGDNAASACGVGAVRPGSAFVSLGTSGVLFVSNDRFSPNVDNAVHAFCHAIPNTWHQMGVILSATDSLEWLSGVLEQPAAKLTADLGPVSGPAPLMFLPYLSGERTPHNDVSIRGAFAGIDHGTDRHAMTHAVLDGVAFAIRDCMDALAAGGSKPDSVMAVGGGSRSEAWLSIIASLLGIPVEVPVDGDFGGAFGAARLGICAAEGTDPANVCSKPTIGKVFEPVSEMTTSYDDAHNRWRALYPALKEIRL
ncbi:MAG: xylulokinase [Stappiaceae bacterium]